MQAIILAAGIGERLRPITDDLPKAMMPFLGKPLLERTLENLNKCGITKVIIVVGYKKQVIIDYFGDIYKNVRIIYIPNDMYNSTNNIFSLWLAKEYLNCDTILLECDIVFDPCIIKGIMSGEHENLIVVDKYKPGMDGTVVRINLENEVTELIPSSKQPVDFEYKDTYKTVNIYYFSEVFLSKHLLPALHFYINSKSLNAYYEVIVGIIVYIEQSMLKAYVLKNVKWYEIDDQIDLNKAEYQFSNETKRLDTIKNSFGGYWKYDFYDFCYIVNKYFPPPSLYAQFKSNLTNLMNNYPSSQRYIDFLISRIFKVTEGKITVTNGASQIIKLIDKFVEKYGKVIISIPTFNEYINAIRDKKNVILFQCNKDDFSLDGEKFVEECTSNECKTAVLINPNNPTGTFIPLEQMRYIIAELGKRGVFVFVDESFIDFVSWENNCSLLPFIDQYENLIIIRSLSKDMGIPGLRLGFLSTANQKILTMFRDELPIWNINSFAEFFLELFLKYKKFYKESCKKIIEDREVMYQKLLSFENIEVFPSYANFFLIELLNNITSKRIELMLFKKYKILIKSCTGRIGLGKKEYIRVALRTKKDNNFFLDAFSSALEINDK